MVRCAPPRIDAPYRAAVRLCVLLWTGLALSCGADAGATVPRPPEQLAVPPVPDTAASSRWRAVRQWLLQLQSLDVERAVVAPFDLIVTDYSRDGSEAR